MATRNSSEVQRRLLRVRGKRAKPRPPTQTSDAAMGSSRPRNSTRARKARSAKHSSPLFARPFDADHRRKRALCRSRSKTRLKASAAS
jgi:hypothetical protein